MERAEFRAIHAATAPGLRRYLVRGCGTVVEADDLLQELYLRFLRRAPTRISSAQTRGYLYRIADSLLREHWRGKARARLREESFRGESDVARGENARPLAGGADEGGGARGEMLRHGLSRVSERERHLLWMAYVDEMTHQEIAGAIGVHEKSVKVLLHRARAALRKQMGGEP